MFLYALLDLFGGCLEQYAYSPADYAAQNCLPHKLLAYDLSLHDLIVIGLC